VPRLIEAKFLQTCLLFIDLFKVFDSVHKGILIAYGIPAETVSAIMNQSDTPFYNHKFDYVLRTSVDR